MLNFGSAVNSFDVNKYGNKLAAGGNSTKTLNYLQISKFTTSTFTVKTKTRYLIPQIHLTRPISNICPGINLKVT
jgi:hypothetical protein